LTLPSSYTTNKPVSEVITPELLKTLRAEYRMDWEGVHGYPHWVRVRQNGLRLAETTGANLVVVELFAFLHDICRQNDVVDPGHGQRAAEFAAGNLYVRSLLDAWEIDLLCQACAEHTNAQTEADITVQTCWDADRLDLGRIGIRPDPQRLCTQAARRPEILEWAYRRSRS
jgi:uncharacterized protein